jgi:hypothetical protein
MASAATQDRRADAKPEGEVTALHQRYRDIGISAVAAAARYRSEPLRPERKQAPVTYRDDNDAV